MAEVRDFTSYAGKLNRGDSSQRLSDVEPSYKEKIRNHKLAVVFRTSAIILGSLLFIAVVYIGWRDKEYS